jgi:Ca2+-binding EF-hand superfamily protein
MSTQQNEKRMLEIFKQFDTNNDGVLSEDEIREGFKEFAGD